MQRTLLIGPITGATVPTLTSYLRRALACAPTGQALNVRLDLSCCTDLTIEGARGLARAHNEVQQRGGTLTLTRVPPLSKRILDQQNQDHLHENQRQVPPVDLETSTSP